MRRRSYRGRPTAAVDTGSSLVVLLAGLLLGALSRWAGPQAPILAELTLRIALWVLLASAVALGSRTPLRAALHVPLLLGGMAAANYITAHMLGSTCPKSFLIGWGAAAVLSAVPGWLVWHAREEDRQAWLISACVVALQLAATLVVFREIKVSDLVVTALTAVMLFAGKVKNLMRMRNRRWRR